MTTEELQNEFLLRLSEGPTGYIPSAPDLSGVTSEADPPEARTRLIIDWAINTASDQDLEDAIASMS